MNFPQEAAKEADTVPMADTGTALRHTRQIFFMPQLHTWADSENRRSNNGTSHTSERLSVNLTFYKRSLAITSNQVRQ